MRLALLLLAVTAYGQRWEVGTGFAHLSQAIVGIPPPAKMPEYGPGAKVRHTLRITASHQTVAALRAISREKMPEATALYSVAVCNLTAEARTVDGRAVEQFLEAEGVAVMPRVFSQAVLNRSRSKGVSSLLRNGEAAGVAGMALGSAKLTGAVAGLHPAVPIALMVAGYIASGITTLANRERESALADIGGYGAWLSDQSQIQLAAHGCSPRLSMMGSFQRGGKRTLVIEVE